jgi:L-threonylcarbamoyladenylate synthase
MNQDSINKAAKLLLEGNVVAFPTETVYGLGAIATNDTAIAKIYEVKQRPNFNPLIVHIESLSKAQQLGVLSNDALKLAAAFWPGPLTIVTNKQKNCDIALLATAGLSTIALRVPAHPVAQNLLHTVGKPLAAPSANPSGLLSPTTSDHVKTCLGDKISFILEGAPAEIGIESSIIDCTEDTPQLLRPGFITIDQIKSIIPNFSDTNQNHSIKAPGALKHHYAPQLPIRLNAQAAIKANEAFIAFGPNIPKGYVKVINLSLAGDLIEAASKLFSALHQLDQPQYSGIAVATIPNEGIGFAINDRLKRAAATQN